MLGYEVCIGCGYTTVVIYIRRKLGKRAEGYLIDRTLQCKKSVVGGDYSVADFALTGYVAENYDEVKADRLAL